MQQSETVPQIIEEKPVVDPQSEIPNKFRGRGLTSVIGCLLFAFNSWGANSAYAIYYQEYLNSDVFPGTSKYEYGIVGGLTFGSGLTFGPLINFLVGKIGLKPTIGIGVVFQFVSLMLASFATKFWQLALTQGVWQGLSLALIAIPNIVVIPQWFSSGKGGKRNLALGFSAAGSGFGGILYNIGMEKLLTNHGYQWSMRTQAILCAFLNIIALILIQSRNKHIKPIFKVYDKVVWTNFGVWCLFAWIMFTLFGYVTLMYNLGDFTRSLGYGSTEASVVSTMVSVGILYGRPSIGQVSDIFGPVNMTIVASWLVSLFALAMWIPCRNYQTALVFALFEGSLMGTIWVTMPSMASALIGLRKLGIAMSLAWIACGLFGFTSPILGIALKKDGPENPTQYQNAAIFVGLCYFAAGVMLVIMRGWMLARRQLVDTTKEEELWSVRVPIRSAFIRVFDWRFYKV
ncbi:hypothetical protein OGAPHI_001382 [Ogataea philodendri]|uniref:Uncharacterized protein n=1 Tax=Ogataea philodendri TaxID=1378263 RepID=A0A9P8T8R6_9ASCO|nr:uncharacterized protein OGAPHI_001382 [Ogataea philodendri]KAH3669261.1 hypothetical protein OGAPHI_001382 [Ogataea philodendri]